MLMQTYIHIYTQFSFIIINRQPKSSFKGVEFIFAGLGLRLAQFLTAKADISTDSPLFTKLHH